MVRSLSIKSKTKSTVRGSILVTVFFFFFFLHIIISYLCVYIFLFIIFLFFFHLNHRDVKILMLFKHSLHSGHIQQSTNWCDMYIYICIFFFSENRIQSRRQFCMKCWNGKFNFLGKTFQNTVCWNVYPTR